MKTITIPGSKSYTNRALLLAALTPGPVTLHQPLYCDDTEAMLGCLKDLDLEIDAWPEQMIVHTNFSSIRPEEQKLFARDSGTTLRFLLPLLCLVPGVKTLLGSDSLNKRPIKALVDALRQLGAEIDYLGEEGFPPLKIKSSRLNSGIVKLEAGISSQYLSALLMIAPLLAGLEIQLLGKPVSHSYVEMTIEMMSAWGVKVQSTALGYQVMANQSYRKTDYTIEGDYSAAGYFLAMATLSKSTLCLENLNPNSKQGDRQFVDILAKMGSIIRFEKQSLMIQGKGVQALSVDMEQCPDQVQTLAVLAAFAEGKTVITGVRSLRLKETNRILALQKELGKMGINVEASEDRLIIYGGHPHAAIIDTYHDHRMAMAFAIAKTALPSMQINDPDVVNKTFPNFWENFQLAKE